MPLTQQYEEFMWNPKIISEYDILYDVNKKMVHFFRNSALVRRNYMKKIVKKERGAHFVFFFFLHCFICCVCVCLLVVSPVCNRDRKETKFVSLLVSVDIIAVSVHVLRVCVVTGLFSPPHELVLSATHIIFRVHLEGLCLMVVQLRPLVTLHAKVPLEHAHTGILEPKRVAHLGELELFHQESARDGARFIPYGDFLEILVLHVLDVRDFHDQVAALDVRVHRTHLVPRGLGVLGHVLVRHDLDIILSAGGW